MCGRNFLFKAFCENLGDWVFFGKINILYKNTSKLHRLLNSSYRESHTWLSIRHVNKNVGTFNKDCHIYTENNLNVNPKTIFAKFYIIRFWNFQKKFLSCFMTFKTEVDSESLVPTSTLAPAAMEWCAAIGSKATTVEDILGGSPDSGASHPPDELVMKAIQVRT